MKLVLIPLALLFSAIQFIKSDCIVLPQALLFSQFLVVIRLFAFYVIEFDQVASTRSRTRGIIRVRVRVRVRLPL